MAKVNGREIRRVFMIEPPLKMDYKILAIVIQPSSGSGFRLVLAEVCEPVKMQDLRESGDAHIMHLELILVNRGVTT